MTKDGKIKILQFPIANSKGGITQYVLQNWKFIDKSKFQFDFATMSKQLDFEEDLTKDSCNVFYISCYAEDDEEQFKKEFRNILEQGEYDIVHLHTKQWKSMFVEEIAKEVGVKKVIVHAHSTGIDSLDKQKRKKETELHKIVLENLDENIATDYWTCSKMAADFLYGDKISKERIVIMNNAIELSKFKFNESIRNKYRQMFGIKENEIVLGCVGRFAYQKNQEFLLSVFKQLSRQKNNYKLLLVGAGEKEKEYREYVRKNGLEEKVFFTGFRTDVNCILQALDCLCMPSRFEGFPISLVEAQTTGVKCVVSDSITEEVVISDLVKRIPLEQTQWLNELSDSKSFSREKYIDVVRCAGYDIKNQIKEIENGYT